MEKKDQPGADLLSKAQDALYCNLALNDFLTKVVELDSGLATLLQEIKNNQFKEALIKLEALAADFERANDPVFWLVLTKAHLACGHAPQAIAAVNKILAMPNLQTRFKIQVLGVLKVLGALDQKYGDQVFGVVVEMGTKQNGVALVAAYADGEGCLYNPGSADFFSERKDLAVRSSARNLIAEMQTAFAHLLKINTRLPIASGKIRFTALTARGLYAREDNIKMAEMQKFYMNPAFMAMNYLLSNLTAKNR